MRFILFGFFLTIFSVKPRIISNTGGTSSSGSGEVSEGEGIIYGCSPEEVYVSDITADVRYPLNCTGFSQYDETIGLTAEGSDWCTFSVDESPNYYSLTNCTFFCSVSGLTCIDAFNSSSVDNPCDDENLAMTCDANHDSEHSCVCWDAKGDFVEYWNTEPRDFLPMLIFVVAFPFFFFMISGFAYYKADSLVDQLEKKNQGGGKKGAKKRGSMSDGNPLQP